MRQYAIGFGIGSLLTPLIGFLVFIGIYGMQPVLMVYNVFMTEPMPEEARNKIAVPHSYHTDFRVRAPFLEELSDYSLTRPFRVFREEPVIESTKSDYQSICVRSFSSESLDLAITLEPSVRRRLLESFTTFNSRAAPDLNGDGYRKRYFIEAKGDRIAWFWVSSSGAAAYRNALQANLEAPDLVLTVPMRHLFNIHYYMRDDMADAPPSGCTPDINPEEIPGWNYVVDEIWRKLS